MSSAQVAAWTGGVENELEQVTIWAMNSLRPDRSTAGEPDREDLVVRRFLLGDSKTLARVESLVSRVVRFRGYYIPPGERRDVVQEVLLQICQALTRPGLSFTENFEAFVRAIAHRRCVDWMRRHHGTEELAASMQSGADPPDRTLLERERQELGHLVLQQLPEGCRELIRLHAAENLPYSKIAELQGRSAGALRVQMYECMNEARGILERIRGGRRPHPAPRLRQR